MEIKKNNDRRQFCKLATAVAGGIMLPGIDVWAGSNAFQIEGSGSTPHFYYRKPSNIPYVDSQNKNMAFAFNESEVLFSIDNSHTWKYRKAFPDAQKITFSHIFDNGNVLFATDQKIYLGKKRLKSIKEITVKDVDGSDYIPHTPKNPENPGWYFHTIAGVNSWQIDGKEILVWGTYANVKGGATPLNIYYSTDNGKSVKIAYSFGQNPYFSDNGSAGGGLDGNLIGNANNPIICRHIHCVAYNPAENAFYACTGDRNRPNEDEVHWLKGRYDGSSDTWDWKVILSEKWNSRYKAGGINFVDGQMYWISDANGEEPYDRGIFRCDPADLANPEAHTMLFNPKYESSRMIIQDGFILAVQMAVASPYTLGFVVSPDLGKTWVEYDIQDFGPYSPSRIHKMNDEGWFRCDLRKGWIDRAEYMFLKPKKV
ncbi:hypothetical protein [Membranihabitans marinus]|uniref:hypothetical protein n=1 Tax=Membranihabitans marinus TaxID=1227546 RepID=UPI001F439AD2|nr:hypothetical protein [Membranihabitans marinus]